MTFQHFFISISALAVGSGQEKKVSSGSEVEEVFDQKPSHRCVCKVNWVKNCVKFQLGGQQKSNKKVGGFFWE